MSRYITYLLRDITDMSLSKIDLLRACIAKAQYLAEYSANIRAIYPDKMNNAPNIAALSRNKI